MIDRCWPDATPSEALNCRLPPAARHLLPCMHHCSSCSACSHPCLPFLWLQARRGQPVGAVLALPPRQVLHGWGPQWICVPSRLFKGVRCKCCSARHVSACFTSRRRSTVPAGLPASVPTPARHPCRPVLPGGAGAGACWYGSTVGADSRPGPSSPAGAPRGGGGCDCWLPGAVGIRHTAHGIANCRTPARDSWGCAGCGGVSRLCTAHPPAASVRQHPLPPACLPAPRCSTQPRVRCSTCCSRRTLSSSSPPGLTMTATSGQPSCGTVTLLRSSFQRLRPTGRAPHKLLQRARHWQQEQQGAERPRGRAAAGLPGPRAAAQRAAAARQPRRGVGKATMGAPAAAARRIPLPRAAAALAAASR